MIARGTTLTYKAVMDELPKTGELRGFHCCSCFFSSTARWRTEPALPARTTCTSGLTFSRAAVCRALIGGVRSLTTSRPTQAELDARKSRELDRFDTGGPLAGGVVTW